MVYDLVVLAEQLGIRLKAKGYRIATAESCTGGWIAQALTEIPGSSAWFDRGFVTYSNLSKIQMLSIDPQVLSKCGAVSLEIAQQMLAGVFSNSEADIAIAVTGIAGPDGGSDQKPVGTVYVGCQLKTGLAVVEKLHLSGNRHQIRKETVSISIAGALALLC